MQIAPKGHRHGPCERACRHHGCQTLRAWALTKCARCGEALGYERDLVMPAREAGEVGVSWRHAGC